MGWRMNRVPPGAYLRLQELDLANSLGCGGGFLPDKDRPRHLHFHPVRLRGEGASAARP